MNELLVTFITVTLLILLLVAGVLITFIISSRQRIRQQMELAETKLAFEKELRAVENEVRENMMAQFARELHDNIGQLLTALHVHIENQKLDKPEQAQSFRPAEIYIAEIDQQLRMLSRTLNQEYIGDIGLLQALQVEIDRLRALKRFQVHFIMVEGYSNLEKNQELMVFRIFQEIAQNALRHAKAKNLYVEVHTEGSGFMLTVKDDGKGFDVQEVLQSSKASGLKNIQKRAALAGLELKINSTPNEGSLFIIKKVSNLPPGN